jgi:hypothetical protein
MRAIRATRAAVDMGRISGAFRILAALRMACGFPMCMLVEFDGKPIENLYDFTYALRQHQPGDKVQVKVLRNGAPVVADVVLTKRNQV